MFEKRLYGHRGASARLPENTIPAFRRALEDGANALELDVHVTTDGEVVVSHDPDARRMGGVAKPIVESTLREVQSWRVGTLPDGSAARIPTLDEVLATFGGVRINVDIKPKTNDAVQPVLEIIGRHGAAGRVTLASFHDHILAEVQARHYTGEIGLTPREMTRLVLTPSPLLRVLPLRGHAVQVPTRGLGIPLDRPAFVRRCHAHGLRVDYWVIDDPTMARHLLEVGADGIMTNDPAAIAPVMAAIER